MTALDKKINQLAARHRWNVTPVHDRFINRCRSLGLTTDENKKYVIDEKTAPTVRFHLKNAAEKLHVVGRSQAVREAAALGYVGLELNPARHAAPAGAT